MSDRREESMSVSVCLSALLMAALPLAAVAQVPSSVADPNAAVAPVEYASVFERYQPTAEAGDAPTSVWRAANEEVARIGGHAGYLRAAQETQAGASMEGPGGMAAVHAAFKAFRPPSLMEAAWQSLPIAGMESKA
jgi:hypothetical protein